MKTSKIFILISLSLMIFSFINIDNEKVYKNFKLLNVDGKYVSLTDYPAAKGFIIVFTCNHCPFAKLYPERLNKLNAKYNPQGVPLIAISSTDTLVYEDDSYMKMVEKSVNEKFNYPYLYDGDQNTARDFNAQKTPHAYVLWKDNEKWIVKYSGAIDDNGASEEDVKNSYVANAVDLLLAGKSVKIKETKSIGCQIYFRK